MNVFRLLIGLAVIWAVSPLARAVEPTVGAVIPWTTYEAEQTHTNGAIIGPAYTGPTPAREASGRRYVRLSKTGQYLQFSAKADAQGFIVRYCIPDSPKGGGIHATLSLIINGKPFKKLHLTSKYCYLYGKYPYTNDPSAGSPRHFWDELRLMPGTIHRGDTIRLQKNADDTGSQYLIDLVDLEPVPPPLKRPANSLSVLDYGAVTGGKTNAGPAFLAAIKAAKSQHKSVWIPAGRFLVKGPIQVSDVTLGGAGMWDSTLVGAADYTPANRVAIYGDGSNIHLSNFAIIGNLTYRNDTEANDGLGGSFGTGSTIRNIWVEHTKTGAWLVNSDGLLVEGCRFRDTIADGINLCVGMRNTTVRNCTVRGNGDDCFAIWPATYIKPLYSPGFNRFVHCTGQLPFLAQAFSIYGGEGNSVAHCEAIDIPYGAGLFASTTFPTEFGFRGNTQFTDSRIIRTGDEDGAIGTYANLLNLAGLRFNHIEVIDSPRDGIKFTSVNGHALSNTTFDQIQIKNAGLAGEGCGILVPKGAVGSATLNGVHIINAKTAAVRNHSKKFTLIENKDNTGMSGNEQASGANPAAPPMPGRQ